MRILVLLNYPRRVEMQMYERRIESLVCLIGMQFLVVAWEMSFFSFDFARDVSKQYKKKHALLCYDRKFHDLREQEIIGTVSKTCRKFVLHCLWKY